MGDVEGMQKCFRPHCHVAVSGIERHKFLYSIPPSWNLVSVVAIPGTWYRPALAKNGLGKGLIQCAPRARHARNYTVGTGIIHFVQIAKEEENVS